MKIKYWEYHGVNPDGTFDNQPGNIVVEAGARWSCEGLQTRSVDGPFLVINEGRNWAGRVRGMTIYFDSPQEVDEFISKATFPDTQEDHSHD